MKDYILSIVFATRDPSEHGLKDLADYIEFGASPRATICLAMAAKAHAFSVTADLLLPKTSRPSALTS